MTRTIAVAGGAGFIGTNLIRRLAPSGAIIRASVHEHPLQHSEPGVDYLSLDLRRPEDCARLVDGVDTVFMCAAATQGAAVITARPLSHVTPNVVMNTQMLAAAHQAGVRRFVFISTGAAYPDTGDRPVTEPEMFQGEPSPVYHAAGWMKRYAEILCETYARRIASPMSCVVVRPSNIYGPYDKFDFATSHVTAALLRRVVERHRPIEIWGSGNDVRDLIYIDDFIDGLLKAADVADPYFVVNICAGTGTSVRQIAEIAAAADGFADVDLRTDPSKPSTVPIRLLDDTLARVRLGFVATTPLSDGFRRTMDWYRHNKL